MRRIALAICFVIIFMAIWDVCKSLYLQKRSTELSKPDSLPTTQVIAGMTLKLDKVQVCGQNLPYGWFNPLPGVYSTYFDYSVDQPNWHLKRLKYCGYRATPTELTWKTYSLQGESMPKPLWASNGPFDLEMGFREVKEFSPQEGIDVPAAGKSVLFPYDCTAFGATLHMIGAFGMGATIPGTGQTAASPCLAFSIQGDPKVTFTVMTSQGIIQPFMALDQIDFPTPQTCIQFPLKQYASVSVYAIGTKERVYHFNVDIPKTIGSPRFYTIN